MTASAATSATGSTSERGFWIRGALGVSDRGNSAASQLAPGQFDWDHLLGTLGVRWLHTGGIFAALSATTPEVVEEALLAAERHGTIISYDLNYRPSLWKANGGVQRAREVNRRLAPHVHVMIGTKRTSPRASGWRSRASARTSPSWMPRHSAR